ncbi:MAG: type II-B CRISPR-associated RNA-guided endonuclease Cas9/Csx12 [Wolinella succinogenes]|uniref:type II-B CRISPR-associated RNA-guided endonuclease Cas9/Csx12 n=1 Tax=Wolinella succinogenes TaxID=844 RepID=UPI0016A75F8C|nr:type II-B CRISPR-associated RNA-guided endonuclease Cas9/Csx12 [Wolinella succinogenes]NLU34197.1 type II-B CRISPR-associated RNA-guided endonuclease Cas9/Csx12 [Wolinella succinogenes]
MLVSPISVDLGGKNTGFFSFTDSLDNSQSGTVIYDESFVLSQVGRRSKRHSKRNNLRNKLVKRLFLLILQEHHGLSIDVLPDEIRGLFNKRGYTYAGFELDEKKKDALESDTLKEFLSEKLQSIDRDSDVEDFLNQIASNAESFKDYKKGFEAVFASATHSPNKKLELKNELKSEYGENAKELLAGLRVTKEILDEFDKQENQGNLPRAKYFEELGEYIATNEKVKSFFDSNSLKLTDMTKLIGNISNYQLKELRRYFNDKEMEKGDIWIPNKLHRITERFVRSWHPKNDADRQRRAELMKDLKSKEIMELLTTTEPVMTIPPYDDMNNRGAVECQTLRLNEEYLDKHLPNWRDIAKRLNHGKFNDDLAGSTVKGYSEDSTLLHRLLDTSKEIDIYELRGKEPNELLVKTLGQSDANRLYGFAQNYYELIRQKVRAGIWTSSDDMLKRCNHNPPHKTNQVHNLVAGILGVKLDEAKFAAFEKELWSAKVGNKKLSAYCKNIEELRKTHGNTFKIDIEELRKKDPAELSKEEKAKLRLTDDVILNEWSQKIANFFDIDDKHRQRFNNLFSMAQLHTVIDTPRSGFSSTCKWCTAENRFRSETAFYNDETGEVYNKATATCQRLPADTQRPFSGKIERYIDKLGFKLAKIKAKELEGVEAKEIRVPIILEQNAFEYEESLRKSKTGSNDKVINSKKDRDGKKLAKAKETAEDRLKDKDKRIKAFSSGICPYCGDTIGDDGEIDHILPRSHTLKIYGTVFNSEGNLIYVHQKCNQAKADSIYKLSDIKAGVSAQWIEEQVANIKSYKTFSVLSAEQQKAFRYALFLQNDNEAYKKVVDWLRTDQSARVNGTQKYLAKKIQEKLTKMLPNKHLSFEFILADATEVSELRRQYARQNPLLAKAEKQAPSSHAIDAVMAFVARYQKVFKDGTPPNADEVAKLAMLDSWNPASNEPLTKGLSTNQKIEKMIKSGDYGQKNMREVFGKSIFGENAIGERYKPIVVQEGGYYIGYPATVKKGYELKNCKVVTSKNDIAKLEKIIKNQDLISLKENQYIKIFSINKQTISELSNRYFNMNYKNLVERDKEIVGLLEFIVENCRYYTKKVDVKFAPKYIHETKYPFYDDWRRFDEAWRYLQENQNKTSSKDRFVIDKSSLNEYYQPDKNEYKLDVDTQPIWDDFCRWYFLDRYKTANDKKSIRIKARKTFSLLAESGVQGKVFRAKRKIPTGYAYQALPMDNNVIAGDYANILLEANSKTLSLVPKSGISIEKQLDKKLDVIKKTDVRGLAIDNNSFFNADFDTHGIRLIVENTSVKVGNFPISAIDKSAKRMIFRALFEKEKGKRKKKTTISFKESGPVQDYLKVFLKKIVKIQLRTDGSISNIVVRKNAADFTLSFRSEHIQKLLK